MSRIQILDIPMGMATSHVVQTDVGALLIDTGYPGQFGRLRARLAEYRIRLEDIRWLLITHHHSDHTGLVAELRRHTRCTMIFHEKALPWLQAGRNDDATPFTNRRLAAAGVLMRLAPGAGKFEPALPEPGDWALNAADAAPRWRDAGLPGTLLHTPGHTEEDLSVVFADGQAVVGDTAANFPAALGLGCRPPLIKDAAALRASWDALLAAGARWILPTHGPAFSADRLAS